MGPLEPWASWSGWGRTLPLIHPESAFLLQVPPAPAPTMAWEYAVGWGRPGAVLCGKGGLWAWK